MTGTGTTTRPLGLALRTLYPGSFTSYQGALFRVNSPGTESMNGIVTDYIKTEKAEDVLYEYPELADKVYKIIRSRIEQDTGIILPDRKRKPIHVIVPGKIDIRIDDNLDTLYCTNTKCGTMWKLKWIKTGSSSKRLPNCPLCGGRVQQAPIFIPVLERSGLSVGSAGIRSGMSIQSLPMRTLFCHYKTPSGGCRAPTSTDKQCVSRERFRDTLGSLAIRDPQRPIASMRRFNPDCPKDLPVPYIPITNLPRQRSVWFKLDFPRESLNNALHASAVIPFENTDDQEITEVNEVISLLLGQFFDSKVVDFKHTKFTSMKILEAVYGYRTGNQTTGFTTSYVGADKRTVIGRIIDTKGFQITIKPSIYARISNIKEKWLLRNDDAEILEVILHTLKHALLVNAPIFTGLDDHKFHGTFEISDGNSEWAAKVFVYDAEDGGSGGFSTIMRNKEIITYMLDDVRLKKIHCPIRNCNQACKHCIYIKNCGFVNRKLNRKLLIDSGIFLQDP